MTNDYSLDDILVGPRPVCPKCSEKMLLQRPWRKEVFYRQYWKCSTKGCKQRIQINDAGNPIIKEAKDAK